MAKTRSQKTLKDFWVLDASVILKWVLPLGNEAHQEEALTLAKAIQDRQVEPLVPALWIYEVGNLLARCYPEQAQEQLADLSLILGVGESMHPAWCAETLRLTRSYAVTFYDAAYHALAIIQKAQFVTADEKYLRAVRGEAGVVHIKDW